MTVYEEAFHGTALVAEDHSLYRMGLANLLASQCGFRTVHEASSLEAALRRLGEDKTICFATFDLDMPGMNNGSGLLTVRRAAPNLLIVVVSASENRRHIIASLIAGVHGYVTKSLDTTDLVEAFRQVISGRIFVPWSVSESPAAPEATLASTAGGVEPAGSRLTERQQEIFRLLRLKRSNKEIARELGVTENTVKVHTVALYRALGMKGRGDAMSIKVD